VEYLCQQNNWQKVAISHVTYDMHIGKTSGKETMRVDYYAPNTKVCSEWYTLNRAYHFMADWFAGEKPSCASTTKLVQKCRKEAFPPTHIYVERVGKFLEVRKKEFSPRLL